MTALGVAGKFLADEVTLKYEGGPVAQGELDTYSVGGAIIAFGDFVGLVSERVYSEPPEVRTTVQGLRSGSFDIQFAVYVAGIAASLFGGPVSPLDWVKWSLEAMKHLGGKPPARTEEIRSDNGIAQVRVENDRGVVNIIQAPALNIAIDQRARRAAQAFVKEPVERGVESVALVRPNGREIIRFDAMEAQKIVPIVLEDIDNREPTESVSDVWVTVHCVYFVEGRRAWQFHDGQSVFNARIDDPSFLRRFAAGEEAFAMGDQLKVRLRRVQTPSGGKIKVTNTIERVLEHRRAAQQYRLI